MVDRGVGLYDIVLLVVEAGHVGSQGGARLKLLRVLLAEVLLELAGVVGAELWLTAAVGWTELTHVHRQARVAAGGDDVLTQVLLQGRGGAVVRCEESTAQFTAM